MSEIPDDTMTTAMEVARKVREDYGLPPNRVTLPTGFGSLTIVNDDLATYTIARAIMEERERCADVARDHANCPDDCGDVIAAAIRNRP